MVVCTFPLQSRRFPALREESRRVLRQQLSPRRPVFSDMYLSRTALAGTLVALAFGNDANAIPRRDCSTAYSNRSVKQEIQKRQRESK